MFSTVKATECKTTYLCGVLIYWRDQCYLRYGTVQVLHLLPTSVKRFYFHSCLFVSLSFFEIYLTVLNIVLNRVVLFQKDKLDPLFYL